MRNETTWICGVLVPWPFVVLNDFMAFVLTGFGLH